MLKLSEDWSLSNVGNYHDLFTWIDHEHIIFKQTECFIGFKRDIYNNYKVIYNGLYYLPCTYIAHTIILSDRIQIRKVWIVNDCYPITDLNNNSIYF